MPILKKCFLTLSMTLKLASVLFGLFWAILGGLWLIKIPIWNSFLQSLPRSKWMSYILFGSAFAWFMFEISLLGPADFGPYRPLLFAIFGSAGILSFYFIPDFLSIRGLAGLGLLSAQPLLTAAYCQPYTSRLWLVTGVYIMIILSMILGTYPYLYRNAIHQLYKQPFLLKITGSILFGYGIILISCSFFYS